VGIATNTDPAQVAARFVGEMSFSTVGTVRGAECNTQPHTCLTAVVATLVTGESDFVV
jgi:hypothetical protein